jgi:hypothetical protein
MDAEHVDVLLAADLAVVERAAGDRGLSSVSRTSISIRPSAIRIAAVFPDLFGKLLPAQRNSAGLTAFGRDDRAIVIRENEGLAFVYLDFSVVGNDTVRISGPWCRGEAHRNTGDAGRLANLSIFAL